MPNPIEKNNIFSRPIYKDIMFLLTFIPEGLEPSEIMSILAGDKTLKDLQRKGIIKYDFNRKHREVKNKLNKKGAARYFETLERGNITTPQMLSNKLAELVKLGVVEKNNKKIKITDDYLRQGTKILLIDHLFSYEPRPFNFLDKKNLKRKKKKLIEAYSKSFDDFSESEKKQIEKHFIEMKTHLMGIRRILSEKIVSKWLEQVRDFYKTTDNERIKKAIMDGIAVHLFQMINLPFFIFEKCRKQKFTELEYYLYTGMLIICFLDKRYGEGSLNTKKTKQVCEIKNDRQFLTPKPIINEMYYIDEIIQKDGKYDINQFCKIWSEYFFWKDHNFTIHDIKEIIDWTWSKTDVLRNIYNDLNFVITSSVRCDGIISEMLVGLGNESTDWAFMPLIIK